MGGYLALVAASDQSLDAAAVVAICPASAGGLRQALRTGEHRFDADAERLSALLAEHDDLHATVDALEMPRSAAPRRRRRGRSGRSTHASLPGTSAIPSSRLIVVPGGHHRSIQHDEELQAVSTRFIEQALGAREPPTPRSRT